MFFAIALLVFGQAQAAFLLKTKCEVKGDGVYLSDLVELKSGEPVPAILIDASPRWGEVREYTPRELIGLIKKKANGVELLDVKKDDLITVSRIGRALEAGEVLELLRAELQKSPAFNQGELELEMVRPWTTLLVPDDLLELRMVSRLSNPVTQTSLRFQLVDGGIPLGFFSLSVRMFQWKEGWVASRQITRGMLLTEAQLDRQRVNMIQVRQGLWDGNPSDGRYWFRENISPGRLVYDRSVVMKPVLKRGGLAKAVVSVGSLKVSTKVKALEDGAPGEVVRVQNVRTRKELIGEVIDENTIKITD